MTYPLTPSQTVGPFLHIGFDWLNTSQLAAPGVPGERVLIQGCLFDADRQPIPDGVIELWQANAQGKYAHSEDSRDLPIDAGFQGFGRIATDALGCFSFTTIKPGTVPDASGQPQAPHIVVQVFARGLIKQCVTRVYFPGDEHDGDSVLQRVPVARRATLIAVEDKQIIAAPTPTDLNAPKALQWNICIGGGPDETVFFEF
jgi:protocatechuate 3,4-dioxygenase alpha subunit